MDIILKGQHSSEEVIESLQRVMQLFKEHYNIDAYRDIYLSVTLVSEKNEEVELVDSETDQAYRIFEVYRQGYELTGRQGKPRLQLVVDNT